MVCIGDLQTLPMAIGIALGTPSRDQPVELSKAAVADVEAIIDGSYYSQPALRTGYASLDEMLGGLRNGDMYVLAGRPSMGKTALAVNILQNMAIHGTVRAALFTMEMSSSQISQRFISAVAGVDLMKIRSGRLSGDEKAALRNASSPLRGAKLLIDDCTGLSPLALRAKCRRLAAREKVQIFVVDYLQLMEASGSRSESRQQEITVISRHIKSLARELDRPILVLSQLNRLPEGREGHIPRMSDLRESGSIEQDADVVILMHRSDYYGAGDQEYQPTNTAQIIVAKHRNGPTGTVELVFRADCARFENLASLDELPAPF